MSDDRIVSYGWCMPSESVYPNLPAGEITRYPDDCGQPHVWERMTSTPYCDCVYCTYHHRWLECENCMTTWYEDNTDGWDSAWREVVK